MMDEELTIAQSGLVGIGRDNDCNSYKLRCTSGLKTWTKLSQSLFVTFINYHQLLMKELSSSPRDLAYEHNKYRTQGIRTGCGKKGLALNVRVLSQRPRR